MEFDTDELVHHAVLAIKRMEQIERPKIDVKTAGLRIDQSGVEAQLMQLPGGAGHYDTQPVPDVLAYLQNETELTRSTLVRILKDSGRLGEFFNDPQRFMDAVARDPKVRAAPAAGGRHQVRATGRTGRRVGDDALQESRS